MEFVFLELFSISILGFCLFLSIFDVKVVITLFKQRQHKTIKHSSVFSEEKSADANLELPKKKDFVSKWQRENTGNRKVKGTMSLPILILALVLLLICMYVLDSKFN